MDTMNSSSQVLKVLSLEDSVKDFEIIREQLIDAGYNVSIVRAEKKGDFENAIRTNRYDIILADFNLPGYDQRFSENIFLLFQHIA